MSQIYNEKIVKEYYQANFFGTTYFNAKGFTINHAVKLAIEKAYDDIRKVLGDVAKSKISKDNVVDFLTKYYIDYFNSKPINFNKWHEQICEDLINLYNKKWQVIKFTYGKAQKIVNMTFKYLFCIMTDNNFGMKNYLDYYKDCHLTLDKYIMQHLVDEYKEQNVKYKRWDKLNKEEYLYYQKVAKDNWHLQTPLFLKGFGVWIFYRKILD